MKFYVLPILLALPLTAAVYHVDPEKGRLGASGLSLSEALPTVTEALGKCNGDDADEIRVVPGVLPLREEVMISGKVYTAEKPLVLDFGNRWITGTEPVDPSVWAAEGGGLWRAAGYLAKVPFSFLVINGRVERMGRGRIWANIPLPKAPDLKPFQWTREGDDLLLRLPEGQTTYQVSVERGHRAHGIGFTGRQNTHVWVKRARVKFVTNDGFNLHGPKTGEVTRDIHFNDIRADYNWDQGISAHDGCQSVVEDAVMIGNVAGIAHIDHSVTVHRRLILAEGERFDLFFYGQCQNTFEDSYIYSTTAERNLRYKEKTYGDLSGFVFSNSVFHQSPEQLKPWHFALGGMAFRFDASTFWLEGKGPVNGEVVDVESRGLIRHSLFRVPESGTVMAWGPKAQVRLEKTLFDGASVRLVTNVYKPGDGPALRQSGFADAQTGFCKRLDCAPFPGSAKLEGLGAQFSPAMANRVRQYRSGELSGAGFALVEKKFTGNTWALTFNRPVDPLSIAGGLLGIRGGQGKTNMVVQNATGETLQILSVNVGDLFTLTRELRSDLGPIGLAAEISF